MKVIVIEMLEFIINGVHGLLSSHCNAQVFVCMERVNVTLTGRRMKEGGRGRSGNDGLRRMIFCGAVSGFPFTFCPFLSRQASRVE
jgi:hypothetical protein